MKEFLASYYIYIKYVHMVAVFFWAFYAWSAYRTLISSWLNSRNEPDNDELRDRYYWMHNEFNRLVVWEHIAFPIVIITGLTLFWISGWTLDSKWLAIKLAIVFFGFVPMEIYDAWMSHYQAPKVMREYDPSDEKFKKTSLFQVTLMYRGVPSMFLGIFIVMFLAITKPI